METQKITRCVPFLARFGTPFPQPAGDENSTRNDLLTICTVNCQNSANPEFSNICVLILHVDLGRNDTLRERNVVKIMENSKHH